jgi:hypothetical protein
MRVLPQLGCAHLHSSLRCRHAGISFVLSECCEVFVNLSAPHNEDPRIADCRGLCGPLVR